MMLFFKNIILIAKVIFIFFFIDCASDRSRIIMVWHSMRPLGTKILQQRLDEFGKLHPDWQFKQLFYEPETARTNFIISAMGGSGPALFWGASDNIGPFVELDVIKPLEAFFGKSFLDSFLVQPFPANTWFRAHLFQIADQIGNHLCLVYNKAILKSPPTTMNELKQLGNKITKDTDGDGKPDHYVLAWNYTEPYFAVPFIAGYNGSILNEQNAPTLNTEATVKAAQLIYDLANKDRLIP